MASTQYILAACAVVLMMMVHGGEAVKCFECNSHNDTRCADKEPPKDLLVECRGKKQGSIESTFCRKIKQIIEFSVNNLPPETRYIRSCGYEEGKYRNACYQRSGFGGRQEVCACDEDECNGAATIKATFGVLLAAIVVFAARV
jgi:hypothetical protein